MNMTEQLKPCPFCGGKVKSEIKTLGDQYGLYRILFFKCQNKDCGAIISFNNGETYSDYMKAIEAWNRRTDDE